MQPLLGPINAETFYFCSNSGTRWIPDIGEWATVNGMQCKIKGITPDRNILSKNNFEVCMKYIEQISCYNALSIEYKDEEK